MVQLIKKKNLLLLHSKSQCFKGAKTVYNFINFKITVYVIALLFLVMYEPVKKGVLVKKQHLRSVFFES